MAGTASAALPSTDNGATSSRQAAGEAAARRLISCHLVATQQRPLYGLRAALQLLLGPVLSCRRGLGRGDGDEVSVRLLLLGLAPCEVHRPLSP